MARNLGGLSNTRERSFAGKEEVEADNYDQLISTVMTRMRPQGSGARSIHTFTRLPLGAR